MKFGFAEMAQMMDAATALLTVAMISSVGIGLALGVIVALYRFFRHRAANPTLRSAQWIDATAPHSPRSPVPRANKLIRPVDLLGIIILIALTGVAYFEYYASKRSDFETTNNTQVRIQPSPSTVESRQQVPEAAPDQPIIEPPPPTIESQPPTAAARAENINANLCEASSRRAIERTMSSAPTKELAKYVEGLKKGSYAFNWTISGHDAAKQLGFKSRFAVAYDQAAEEVRARLTHKSTVHIDEIIEYFSGILREEQTVDRLAGGRDRHFPAVVYLRALQEGECLFPYVLRDIPTAQAMLNHLARAYPAATKQFASEPFAKIYDATVAYGQNQIKQNGSVSFYRLVEEMRRAIVQSANPNVATLPSTEPQKKNPQTKHTGSGFFVTTTGHLLTNAHVVGDCTIVSVKSTGREASVAKIIAVDQNNDLALLKLERRTETTAAFRIGRSLRAGESAVVFGFPLSQLLAPDGNVTTGVVTALAGPRNDPRQIQISAPVQSGNSGGPVLDASGYLIGVVVSKLDSALGQNVNFAINASTVANFLNAHGIAYKSAAGEKELPIPDIAEQARGFSAQVVCQG